VVLPGPKKVNDDRCKKITSHSKTCRERKIKKKKIQEKNAEAEMEKDCEKKTAKQPRIGGGVVPNGL